MNRPSPLPLSRSGASRFALASALGLWAATSGCTGKSTEQPIASDRALEKLRTEVDRANRGEPVGRAPTSAGDPRARLADLATGGGRPRELKLPERNEAKLVGELAVTLAGLQSMHSVKAGKLQLTSADAFLEVRLVAQNTSGQPAAVDLSLARVQDASGHSYGIAPDAQHGAGTRQLQRTWGPGEREDVTLYFEVPPETMGHPLKLVLPAGVSSAATSDVTLPLD